jgi:hypothetical protein
MDAAAQTIEWLRAELQVEDEWSVETDAGFRWWPGRHAQTMEVLQGDAVSVRTEVMRGLDLWPPALPPLNHYLLQLAALSGAVYDGEQRRVDLCSLVRVDEANAAGVRPLLRLAAGLQAGEARLLAGQLAATLGAEAAESAHPERGERAEAHAVVGTVEEFIDVKYEKASAWTEDEIREAFEHDMDESLAIGGSREGAGFTTEFRCGRSVSVCYVRADQPHPRYGPGLFLLQTMPLAPADEEGGVELALFFNGRDLVRGPLGDLGLGSYAYREGGLYFTTFFPNRVHRPGLLADVYTSCAQRAAAVTEVLAEAR